MSARARSAAALVAALLLGLLAACGVPKDSNARVIAGDKVPFNLLGSTSTVPANQGGQEVDLYFVSQDHLQLVGRRTDDASPMGVLDALVKGVAENESKLLSTAIPQNTSITSAERNGTTLVVTLSPEILSVTGPGQKVAFAQLVYTATALPDIDGVLFRAPDSNGQMQDLEPTTDSGNKRGPLTRDDFRSLDAGH